MNNSAVNSVSSPVNNKISRLGNAVKNFRSARETLDISWNTIGMITVLGFIYMVAASTGIGTFSKCATIKRAFMHVEDVIDAVEIVWNCGLSGEVYNIASDDELTVMEVTHIIIETIKGTTDYDKWITYVDDRPFNDQRYYICAKKLKALGWSPKKTRKDLINFLKI